MATTSELVISDAFDIRLIGISYSMEPVQEDHVGKRLKELQDLIEETKGNPELHPKMTLSSTKYAVSKIIRRCNVGPKWKLTITMKAAAADPTGEIFDSCSKATTVAESDIGHERRWLKNSYLLIKPYIAQFPDKLAFMQLIAQADGPTIYTGRRRQLICQTVWALISLYYSLANALALHLGKQLPSYRIKSKFMFDKFKVGSDGSNTRPSDDELIAGLTNVGSVLHKLVGLNMFQKLAQDLGSIYKNAERLKESPPTQSDIHLRESVQPPDHINKGTMETSNNADVGGAAQLDVETETGDDDNDDNDVPDVAVPDPESVEEQEAEAEGLPPSSTTLASKFTWRFTAWVRLLVTHLIACQRVQHYIKDKETCLTFTLLDMPYEKMSTGPSMENVLSAMSIGEIAIAKLKDHQREHNNIPKTQSKETTSLLSQFHGVIHSEMALAMSFFNYLRSYPPQTFPKRQFDIGTSKPCCPVCYVFLHIIASVYQIPICIGNYHLTPSPVSLPPNVTDEIGKEIFARIYNTVLKMAQSLQLPPDAVKTYRHSDSGSSTKTDTSVMSDHPEEESDSDDSDDIPFDQFREALRQRS